jgi:hypothetical protein
MNDKFLEEIKISKEFRLELESASNKIFGWFTESKYFEKNYFSKDCNYSIRSFNINDNFNCYSSDFMIKFEFGLFCINYNIIEYLNGFVKRSLDGTFYGKNDEELDLATGDFTKETFNEIVLNMFSIILGKLELSDTINTDPKKN